MPDLPPLIKTSAWWTPLPDDHLRVGISRGIPRRSPAGYRVFRRLAPGPWFNRVSPEEYCRLFQLEILDPLDPRLVAAELLEMGGGRVPVMLCYEKPNTNKWCHRALVAEWLAKATNRPVPEFGFEGVPQDQHPLLPPHRLTAPLLDDLATPAPATEIEAFTGRTATIDGELHRVIGPDPTKPGMAIIAVGMGTLAMRQFSTSLDTLQRQFADALR